MLLNLHSYYSLRYGTISLEQLVAGMLQYGYDQAVLTDINNSSASIVFAKLGQAAGLHIISGMEYRNGDELLYIGIAKNTQGFQILNELMTKYNQSKLTLPAIAPIMDHVWIIYPLGKRLVSDLAPHEFIGIRPHERRKLPLHDRKYMHKFVILAPVTFDKDTYTLHKQLRAIDHNILLSQLQTQQIARPDETWLPKATLMEYFKDFPQLIANTNKLLSQCSFDFDYKSIKNKISFTGNVYNDRQLLYKYAIDGQKRRYGSKHTSSKERILKELDIIDRLHFSSYFLITDDICRYARSRGFHYVGRGSGANSIVAYCLGITDVDPIDLNLPFERFLNPKRSAPPDFDIDFSWRDRDEMYDYIFNRYQSGHTGLMGAMSTFRSRSILRELGKVYGLPKGEIDRLVRDPEHVLNKNEVIDTILAVYNQMADFPNQRTIHASGVLISEAPLTAYAALDYPPKGLPTIQLDMYVAEDIGFEKFDILSQRGIGHIKDCAALIQENRGIQVDTSIPKRFFEDKHIAAQLKSANTVGCFYIESPAMRQLLTKLRCDNYLTLVAASSIIRPGVSSSGMMATYIARHHQPESVTYLHPVFKEQLEETYGVMVYQEDVMKIANAYGGLDMADADVLRRMMSGKYRSKKHLIEIEDKYFANCKAKGYDEAISKEIWRQMESFAGYSFNKAHSASFAVESYQSLYLKTYFPLEFMVSVLNNYGGFYSRKVYVNEAKRSGATICLPCIQHSVFTTTIKDKSIYLGFDGILNLQAALAHCIVSERVQNGAYSSLDQFVMRTNASLEQLIILIRVGAFRSINPNKKALLWEAHLLCSSNTTTKHRLLFSDNVQNTISLPILKHDIVEDYYDELELLGFPVSGSMFDLAKSDYRGNCTAANLAQYEGQVIRIVGDYVTEKPVRTKQGAYMKFGTFFDVAGDFFDTVHFPNTIQQFPIRGEGLYLIEGKVIVEYGCPIIDVYKCGKMPLKLDPRSE